MIRDTYSLTRFLRPLSFYPHIRCKRLIKQNRELSTDYKPDVYLSSLLLLGAEWEQEQVQQGIRYTSGEKTFAARLQHSAILCFMYTWLMPLRPLYRRTWLQYKCTAPYNGHIVCGCQGSTPPVSPAVLLAVGEEAEAVIRAITTTA